MFFFLILIFIFFPAQKRNEMTIAFRRFVAYHLILRRENQPNFEWKFKKIKYPVSLIIFLRFLPTRANSMAMSVMANSRVMVFAQYYFCDKCSFLALGAHSA